MNKQHNRHSLLLKTGGTWAGIALLSMILMGSSCPTYEPPPPPALSAPEITSSEIAGYWSPSSKTVQPAVQLQWTPPGTDSVGIQSFTILRKAGSDSLFSTLRRAIPPQVLQYHDITDEIIPTTGQYTLVCYRVFAIDSLGRTSDTSAIDSVELATPARIVSPLDTLFSPVFKWAAMGTMSGFYTYMYLWDSLGLRWQSPKPSRETYLADYQIDSVSVRLADSLLPLPAGRYFWGAKMDILNGRRTVTTGSMSIGSFYVP